ncbi:rhodanese-like domain-containing protein [Bacillaceae bacterium]
MAEKTIPRITSEELYRKMEAGQELFILDVRNEEEYLDWKIEGKTLTSMNIPYFDFLEEEKAEEHAAKLPKDKEIVVVCAKGGASHFIVEMLVERGFRAFSLEGGMLAWSQFYAAKTVAQDEQVKLLQVNRLAKGCLSYMVISEGKALVVDPSRHIDEYLKLAEKEGAVIEHIVDTHLHADHISGGQELAKRTGATYYLSSSDLQGGKIAYEPLEKYDTIRFGAATVKVLAIQTPGHTPGSTSFLVNDRYFLSGDTVFVSGLGRPDLGGKAQEWAQALYDTVFNQLSELSDDVIVLPAHYSGSGEVDEYGIVQAKLGDIRNSNKIMQTVDRTEFTEAVAASTSTEKPPNFEEIVAINRGDLTVDAQKATELEIGPNRCAVHHAS